MQKWIRNNFQVTKNELGEEVIIFNNGISTNVSSFENMFGDVIENAINNNLNVKEEIKKNDNGRGFASLIE